MRVRPAPNIIIGIWVPGWHNFDQSIAVDMTHDFCVYSSTPDPSDSMWPEHDVRSPPWRDESVDFVFYNRVLKGQSYEMRRLRIVSIQHPGLGPLKSIQTGSFGVYEFETEYRSFSVEAEGDPGLCQDSRVQTRSWAVRVKAVEP